VLTSFVVNQHFSVSRIVTFCSFVFPPRSSIFFIVLDTFFSSYIKATLSIGHYILTHRVYVVAELAGFNLDL
jgi:hypothetical protein